MKSKSIDAVSEFAESIFNTVREPLIALDQDLRAVKVNRSFCEVFKVKPEETVGQLIYDLGNKQWDIPGLRELLETILPQRATFDNYEVKHDFAGIGKRTMLLNARQIRGVLGKERIILLAIEDITERKAIEDGLEKTRKELEAIKIVADDASEFAESVINTVREPLLSLDQDLRVVTVSHSFYEFFKVKPEDTVGKLIYDLGNKQWDIPKLRELLETILPRHATFDNYEVEHDFAGIGRRTMLLNARQIRRASGKERIILLAIEDITERKQTKEASARLAAIVESSDDAIIGKDLHGMITSWNAGAERLFGYSAQEMIGHSIMQIIPNERVHEEEELVGRIRRSERVQHFETVRLTKNGKLIDVSVTASPIRDASGNIVGASKVARDIGERKKSEKEIQTLNAELESRVIERTAQMEIANKELDAFAYSVSHDLRAPLRSIDGFSLVLLEDYAQKLDAKGKDSLQRVRSATQRMAQLIDDILSLSRISRFDLRRVSVNLSEMASDIAMELRKTEPNREMEFVIAPGIKASGDQQLLHIVLDNLMRNAFKFTSKHQKARIEFGSAGRNGTTAYYIRDDGAGFDMNYADKMFGAFQRMHSLAEFPGTGIGLATVQRVINRHGGAVWGESEIEKGATFYFTLGATT